MLEKHDYVLRQMREKWAIMQRLKSETRKDTGSVAHGSTRKFETMRSPSKSFSDAIGKSKEFLQQDDYTMDMGNIYDYNSFKRRGRPPKMQKTSHLNSKNH